ncbi:AraC family transcriptional regulator [Aquabacterium sp.]|uniref:helix-turn-helix domain-containing protein n=1 Tax=Aquabacterium sp. TaxID=1872578 RepID=UPI0025C2D0A0|nr:AraC family transcriptional regulator [Aquabacterium sp.]
MLMRVTGAWTQLLTDWLDAQRLPAPTIRARLAAYAPDDVVPLDVWREILDMGAALRPDLPAPGLSIGAGVLPRHVGVLGYLVLASDNLAEAVSIYQRYERLFYGVDLAEVVMHQGEVEIRWARTDTTGVVADETAIAALVTFLRKQIDNPPPPSRVGFVYQVPPERAQACEAFFGCPVDFGASHTLVRFPVAYMSIPMPHREPGLRALLDRQAKALLDALPDPNAFDKAVQQLLVRLLPDGDVSVDKVAQAMNQSTRTLQRRLADSGMTWQHLLDRTREQLARQYLSDRALSLAEIALLLGYSEQSAFTRSFKRWTGLTPLGFRTQTVHI